MEVHDNGESETSKFTCPKTIFIGTKEQIVSGGIVKTLLKTSLQENWENAQWNNQPKEITPVYGSTKQQQESDDTNKQEFMCYNCDLFRYLEPYHQMLF